MRQIIILGLITTIALAAPKCDVGKTVSNFDYNKFAGTWFFLYHQANKADDKLECTFDYYYEPRDGRGSLTTRVYDKAQESNREMYGLVTQFNNTGYEVKYLERIAATWTGRMNIIAIDYNRYFIGKLCSKNFGTVIIYVAFRHRYPDAATLNDAKKAFSGNGIAFDKLKDWNTDRCKGWFYNSNIE